MPNCSLTVVTGASGTSLNKLDTLYSKNKEWNQYFQYYWIAALTNKELVLMIIMANSTPGKKGRGLIWSHQQIPECSEQRSQYS